MKRDGVEVFVQDLTSNETLQEILHPHEPKWSPKRHIEVIPGHAFAIKVVLTPSFRFGRYKKAQVDYKIDNHTGDCGSVGNVIVKTPEFKNGRQPLRWERSQGRFMDILMDLDFDHNFAFGRHLGCPKKFLKAFKGHERPEEFKDSGEIVVEIGFSKGDWTRFEYHYATREVLEHEGVIKSAKSSTEQTGSNQPELPNVEIEGLDSEADIVPSRDLDGSLNGSSATIDSLKTPETSNMASQNGPGENAVEKLTVEPPVGG